MQTICGWFVMVFMLVTFSMQAEMHCIRILFWILSHVTKMHDFIFTKKDIFFHGILFILLKSFNLMMLAIIFATSYTFRYKQPNEIFFLKKKCNLTIRFFNLTFKLLLQNFAIIYSANFHNKYNIKPKNWCKTCACHNIEW